MSLNRKYAALPDLDNAPDIYETPELTDDNSTVLTAPARALSDDEFYEVDDSQGISRASLRIKEARSRFAGPNDADFSDRVDGKRRSYRASSRRQRALQGGDPEELGGLSDDDIGESLERRIARLKREVEEAKEEYAKRRAVPPQGSGADHAEDDDAEDDNDDDDDAAAGEGVLELESLSQALDGLSRSAGVRASGRPPSPSPSPPAPAPAPASSTEAQWTEDTSASASASAAQHAYGHSYTITYAPAYEQTHALAKAADFDRRLLMLERSLGISSSSGPESSKGGLPRAILPTLDSLDKQISTLSQASTANLDSISRRVRALAADQEKLNEAREKAKALREELGKHVVPPVAADDSDKEAKIGALYAILPAIESLTPMLPPLLDRLRSLRAIHADAATAGQALDRIEKQQTEMARELKLWREGLDRLEGSIKAGDETMKTNMGVMGGWVRDLEHRMEKFL